MINALRAISGNVAELPLSANKELISIPNIIFIVTGLYFVIVAAIGEGSVYTAIGALLCFVSAGLVLVKDMVISWPWRLATADFFDGNIARADWVLILPLQI